MKTKVILSQQMASAIIAAGQEEAQKNNWSVSIAVADDGGHLLALSRMDDCAPIAAYISQEKVVSGISTLMYGLICLATVARSLFKSALHSALVYVLPSMMSFPVCP